MNDPSNKPHKELRVLISGAANKANAGLYALVNEIEGALVSGVTTGLVDMLIAARDTQPNVILLDHAADSIGFLPKIRMLKEIDPALRIVVLAHQVDASLRRRCMDQGANSVLDKTAELDKLVAVLNEFIGHEPP